MSEAVGSSDLVTRDLEGMALLFVFVVVPSVALSISEQAVGIFGADVGGATGAEWEKEKRSAGRWLEEGSRLRLALTVNKILETRYRFSSAGYACNREVLKVLECFVAADTGVEDHPMVPRDGACLANTLCTPSAANQVRFRCLHPNGMSANDVPATSHEVALGAAAPKGH